MLWPQKQQLQHPGAFQERFVASEAPVTASRGVPGTFGGLRSSSYSIEERSRSVLWPQKQQLQHPGAFQERSVASEAAAVASRNVPGAFCGLRSSSYSIHECSRSVLWPQKQQLQHSGAFQEHSVASEATVTASRSVPGALCGLRSSSYSIQERSRSVLWPQKQQLQQQQQQHLQLHNQRLEEEQEQQPYSGEWKRGLCEPSENKNLMRTKKGRAGLISISNANTICEKKNVVYRSLGR